MQRVKAKYVRRGDMLRFDGAVIRVGSAEVDLKSPQCVKITATYISTRASTVVSVGDSFVFSAIGRIHTIDGKRISVVEQPTPSMSVEFALHNDDGEIIELFGTHKMNDADAFWDAIGAVAQRATLGASASLELGDAVKALIHVDFDDDPANNPMSLYDIAEAINFVDVFVHNEGGVAELYEAMIVVRRAMERAALTAPYSTREGRMLRLLPKILEPTRTPQERRTLAVHPDGKPIA